MPIKRVLIANRGEIAVRIIRTCKALGVETVLAVSSADRDSLGAKLADRSVCIGPPPASASYLQTKTIVQAALGTGCDAIHPGYGFLSERAELAQLCEQEHLCFIGPTAEQIEAVGDKLRARARAEAASVPVVPGGPVEDRGQAETLGRKIGVPLLVKAVGGGGGRGMKRVDDLSALPDAVALASAEAEAAFGDPRIYIERFVATGRHIEVQVLGDGMGGVVQLGERDCSVQRRYQKLIEETPAPHLSQTLRNDIHAAALRFARHVPYRGAGTVEFLVDGDRKAFYFLEMNARIQVEHPITECVSNIDLVAEQIAVAEGRGLRNLAEEVAVTGCAIECRINAEDPARAFMPSPGTVMEAIWPSGDGIRVDTHIMKGASVPPYYDSLMAKLIAHGPDRATALKRLESALAETRITGVATNIDFHRAVLRDPEFVEGGVDTGFLARFLSRTPAFAGV
jgi:acetyl-CoA carboxylase biotin carboxylase subunit